MLILLLLYSSILFTGCWNYREVEQLAIVAGAAIDKHEDGTIHLTAEVVDIELDGQVTYNPVYLEIDADTFFEAARKIITIEGERLYWSHAKVIIVSQEIAKEDITKYLDFLFRDAETREDIWLLVSKEKTAGEVLKSKGKLKPIISFQIDDTMRSVKTVARFPNIELFEFFDRLAYGKVAPVLPVVQLLDQQGEKTPQISGAAVFKEKKMVGMLNEDYMKPVQILRDELDGGLLVIKDVAGTKENVTLEVFKSKSKISPIIQDGVLKMKVEVVIKVNIAEITGSTDFITSSGEKKLISAAEKQLEEEIKATYMTVRDDYKADIFGFGRRIEMKMPDVWNQIKENWDEYFAELELEISVKLDIRGSATTRTPIEVGN